MVRQEDEQRLLEFVEENEQVNTFRLARELGLQRTLVLKMIDQLQKKGAVDYQTGKVVFLSHPKEESVPKTLSFPVTSLPEKRKRSFQKKRNPMILLEEQTKKLSEKNKELKQQLEQAYGQVKELAQYKEMAGDHAAQIERLKSQLEAVQKKAEKKPRIVEKVVVRKVRIPVKQKANKKLISVDVNWLMARDRLKKLHAKFPHVSLPDTFHKKLKLVRSDLSSLRTKVKQLRIPFVFQKQ